MFHFVFLITVVTFIDSTFCCINCIGGVMISVLVSGAVGRVFEARFSELVL